MPESKVETGGLLRINKNALNLILFFVSIAIVVAILTIDRELTGKQLAGIVVIVISCFTVLYLFLLQFRHEVLHVARKTFFLLLSILTFIFLTKIVTVKPEENLIYLVPFAMIPVIVRIFYDARLALFSLLITIMLSGFLVPDPFGFIFMSFISGMVAIFTLTSGYRRARLLFTAPMVAMSNIILYLGITLMRGGDPAQIFSGYYILFLGNGLLVLLSYPVILLFEKNFLFLSETTLFQLADTNNPLLRKLAIEAPGSYQHSLQVANLAEEAARQIGSNPLLVRVGALYHDIGKIANPQYFIENMTDTINPHDSLDPKESSKLIIKHVKNGVILGKNYQLPVQVIDFIRTHHGTTVAYYFYKKFIDIHPEKAELESDFSYPGPKPFSKETAVVMMADAVEASSRTLGKYTEDEISELVERIVYLQEQANQFTDVPLTFRDISDIKSVFKKRLSNIYHPRVVYPERF